MATYKVFDKAKFDKSNVFAIWFRRYAPFREFGAVGFRFEGDHRSGSTSSSVTSRTYGGLFFNKSEILYGTSGSSGTKYTGYAPWTIVLPGGLLARLLNDDVRGTEALAKVSLVVKENVRPGIVEFSASTAGNNPLVPGSPNIDTHLKARIDFSQPRLLGVSGRVFGDDFPNLEVFLISANGRSALLVDAHTTGGQDSGPMTGLPGSGENHLLGQFNNSLSLDDRGQLVFDTRAAATRMLPSKYRGSGIRWR
jgi:hypothetical protein